jgi:hypothetical protein
VGLLSTSNDNVGYGSLLCRVAGCCKCIRQLSADCVGSRHGSAVKLTKYATRYEPLDVLPVAHDRLDALALNQRCTTKDQQNDRESVSEKDTATVPRCPAACCIQWDNNSAAVHLTVPCVS